MSYYFNVALTLNTKDLPEIINKYFVPGCDGLLKFFDWADKEQIIENENGVYIVFKWDAINHYDETMASNIIADIASDYLVDYLVITEEDEVMEDVINIGLVEYQNKVVLTPGDFYLQQSWRIIKALKNYIKENCDISDEALNQMIADANMKYFNNTYD